MENNEMANLLKDYDNYVLENKDFFDKYRDNESLIYDRIENVIRVIKYFKKKLEKQIEIDKNELLLLQMGIDYIYEYQTNVESIEKRMSNQSIESVEYLICLLLDFEDYLSDYESNDNDQEIYQELEDITLGRKEFDDKVYLAARKILEKEDYLSILSIFEQYVDIENIT